MDKNIIEGELEEFLRFANARCLLECNNGGRINSHTAECVARLNIVASVRELFMENEMLARDINGLQDRFEKLCKSKKK